MISVYQEESRNSSNLGWLRGSHRFSFENDFDEENSSFGPMHVLNDDTITPKRGFGPNPRTDMEILYIVLNGKLRHADSLGNVMNTSFGSVQRMSAGTGVVHMEHNPSETDDVTFLQLWFEPEQRGLAPSYEATSFEVDALSGRLLPIASSNAMKNTVAKLHQNMTVYLSKLKQGSTITFKQEEGRRVFLFVIEGRLSLSNEIKEGAILYKRDSARIVNETKLKIEGEHEAAETFFMLIDLP
ncbi:hypothetical protein A8990_104157 [Paenibacillus taihuensis]|uniref:Pirin N-terminal domain-containing protein n=1 Tax=Paenibacillus taihuensis TaxID=1156355 RepID=A0A3D9SM29_9BACL|nr:pirin family protein [Paenibacillus taihuensis]REE91649.1 hypothetical protein A8990_104157 [Paenibacillus taihuensis]